MRVFILIDNQRTEGHQSLIFGVRESDAGEILEFCSNNFSITDVLTPGKKFNLTSDCELRIYA